MLLDKEKELFNNQDMPDTFIQWKGTNVCIDFHCKCGAHLHFDCDFLYYVHCAHCARVYQMGTRVVAEEMVDGVKLRRALGSSICHTGYDDGFTDPSISPNG